MDKEALKTLVRLGQEIEAQPPLPPLPEQEPVGYVYSEKGVKHGAIQTQRDLPNGTPLYAAPLPVQEPVLMQERRAKRMSGSVITEWSEWYASQYNTPEEARADEFFAEHIPHEWRQLCVVPTTPPLPVQEPVARVIDNGTPEGSIEWIPFTNRVEPLKTGDLLYTTTPRRTWKGLTVEDITKIDQGIYPTWKDEVQAIEARLKELNNG